MTYQRKESNKDILHGNVEAKSKEFYVEMDARNTTSKENTILETKLDHINMLAQTFIKNSDDKTKTKENQDILEQGKNMEDELDAKYADTVVHWYYGDLTRKYRLMEKNMTLPDKKTKLRNKKDLDNVGSIQEMLNSKNDFFMSRLKNKIWPKDDTE